MVKDYKVQTIQEWSDLLKRETSSSFASQITYLIDVFTKDKKTENLNNIKDLLDFYVYVGHQEMNPEVGSGEIWEVNTQAVPQEALKLTQSLYNTVYGKQAKKVLRNYKAMAQDEAKSAE